MTIPSALDWTLAPKDGHVVLLFTQYAPAQWPTPNQRDVYKQEYVDRWGIILREDFFTPSRSKSVSETEFSLFISNFQIESKRYVLWKLCDNYW